MPVTLNHTATSNISGLDLRLINAAHAVAHLPMGGAPQVLTCTFDQVWLPGPIIRNQVPPGPRASNPGDIAVFDVINGQLRLTVLTGDGHPQFVVHYL